MEMAIPKGDIVGRPDLELLIRLFYERLLVDPEIGHFFSEVVHLDMEHHLPRIVSFWEMVLLQSGDYQGDPMAVHLRLNGLSALSSHHFEVWLRHFGATVDELFAGANAELAKQRAQSIAFLMQVKLQRGPN